MKKWLIFFFFFFNTQATDLLGAKHLFYHLFSYFRLFIPLFSVIYSFKAIIKCARQAIFFFFSQDCNLKVAFKNNHFNQFFYIYTGAGHIIRISSKSWFISLIPFKKWNLYNVYIHSTQTDIFQVVYFF